MIFLMVFRGRVPMLTKSVNKVSLLSYNACESQDFSAFKAGF